jgi:hypothetical protein
MFKPLLTKEERQTLSRREKKLIRRARREARAAERDREPLVHWPILKAKATVLIMDLVDDAIPGPAKMEEVLDALADEATDYLVWAGPLAAPVVLLVRELIRPVVQRVYDELAEMGFEVDDE